MSSHSRDILVVEVTDCGWEVHDQTARVVKSETLRVGGSSSEVLLRKINWKETHLGPGKMAAEAALVECMSECMSFSKLAG